MENHIVHENSYLPVSCDLIDQIEISATNKVEVNLLISNKKNITSYLITSTIRTWYTKNKEEFIVLGNGIHLRMDKIHSINGIKFESICNL